MNIKRFKRILDAYGTRQENWPGGEREAARLLLGSDPECASLLQRYHPLDTRLDKYVIRIPPDLSEKILGKIPRPLIDRLIGWLIPDVRSEIWKPAIAGSLPLILGMMLGASALGNLLDDAESDADWDDEIYLLAFEDPGLAGSVDE
jgi:hypothetical protein